MNPKKWHRYWLLRCAGFVLSHTDAGKFVECGVKQGTSSILMAKAFNRPGVLFDTWKGFPHFSKEDFRSDGRRQRLKNRLHGKDTKKDCIDALKKHGVFFGCQMVQGDICSTVPEFVSNHPALQICFMHVDTDLYDPAKVVFDHFAQKVVPGGGIFVHDYGDKKWPGITKVVDSFIASEHNKDFNIFEFPKEDLYSCFLWRGYIKKFESYYESTRQSLG